MPTEPTATTPPYVPYRRGPKGPQGTPGITGPVGPEGSVPTELLSYLLTAGTVVTTFTQFQNALALGAKKITFGANITVGADITVPASCCVSVHPFKLVQNATPKNVLWYGYLPPIRDQIFQGFLAGQIRGPMGGRGVIPEWWGLVGSNQLDGEHDLAINAALKSNIVDDVSVIVKLDAKIYWVKRTVDARATKSQIHGMGAAATAILGTENFTPDTFLWSGIFPQAVPNAVCLFTAVASGGAGKMIVTTQPGGTTDLYTGQSVTLSGSAVAGYNGTWVIDSITNHQTVVLLKAFAGDSSGTLTPITLDSVMETGDNSAMAIVLIGSDLPQAGRSFFTGLQDLTVNAIYATIKYPLKRVHAIAWTGWIEEQSYINRVVAVGFSGFGVGGESSSGVTTVNGLVMEQLWITKGTRRASLPVFIAPHGNVVTLKNTTIDMVMGLDETRGKPGGPPTYVLEPPQFGILCAGGHTELTNIHIECVHNAIHVFANNVPGMTTIIDCDTNNLLDYGMMWYGDTARQKYFMPDPIADQMIYDNLGNRHAFLYHTACGVSIGQLPVAFESANCFNACVTIINFYNNGVAAYLMRDWIYNHDFVTFGGRYANRPGRQVNFYSRGIPFHELLNTRITAASLDVPSGKTLLTVDSSTGILDSDVIFIKSRSVGDDEYDIAGGWDINSVPSGTSILLEKTWSPATGTMTGWLWVYQPGYNRAAPPVDKSKFFIGPIW